MLAVFGLRCFDFNLQLVSKHRHVVILLIQRLQRRPNSASTWGSGSPYLLIAGDVNAGGEIAGYTGDGFAFLATPDGSTTAGKSNASPPAHRELPANVRRLLMRWGIQD